MARKTKPEKTPETVNVPILMVPRLGNVQAIVRLHGEGDSRRPVVSIHRLASSGTPKDAFEIEDIAALKEVCDGILRTVLGLQTVYVSDAEGMPQRSFGAAILRDGES